MAERIFKLYREGRLSDAGLDRAVQRGWVTQQQADDLRAED